jgi:hypothetical protein
MYLVMMVTPFLVIRSASNAAFAVIYVYLGHDQQNSTGLIVACLLGIISVVLYGGLVSMGFCKDWAWQNAPVFYSDTQENGYGSPIFTQQFDGQAKQPFASATRVN